jgi:hypothetical protein
LENKYIYTYLLIFLINIFYNYFLYKKGKCRFKDGRLDGKQYNGPIYNITSFIWVNQNDDKALMEVLDIYGPVSVGIDASNPKFISYNDDYYGSILGTCNKNYIGIYSPLKIFFFKPSLFF